MLACPAELQEEVHCDWSIDMTNKGVFSNAAQSYEWSGHTNTPTAEVILLHNFDHCTQINNSLHCAQVLCSFRFCLQWVILYLACKAEHCSRGGGFTLFASAEKESGSANTVSSVMTILVMWFLQLCLHGSSIYLKIRLDFQCIFPMDSATIVISVVQLFDSEM